MKDGLGMSENFGARPSMPRRVITRGMGLSANSLEPDHRKFYHFKELGSRTQIDLTRKGK